MVASIQQTQQLSPRRVKTMLYNLQQQQQRPMCMMLSIATILVIALSSPSVINAFTTFIPTHQITLLKSTSSSLSLNPLQVSYAQCRSAAPCLVRLASANTDEGTTEQDATTAENVEVTTDSDTDTVTEITSTDDATAVPATELEEVPPVEDPEITAIKDEIAKMEQEIKSARRQLADINDRADDYTKTGYARKVAEMENMRRARSMLQSSNKYTATAAILTEFLPAMDALNSLKERYEENEFGKMYNALPDAIRGGYTSMGCTEYSIETNAMFDANRMTMIDSEPSMTVPKDGVIRTVIPGMELQGNTIRLAQVVTSMGNDGGAAATPPNDATEATE